ncbi:cell division protein FtsL [Halioglobus maricola]|uniref:Cell division protein FtsL n=1 Tax=Halioglobus maricola TaxID=2601894 RepID=A0A5P9NHG4_9GAMM|nr:cell division protein FtsL [Halioglobus maricola]QFU74975.1 cell division protein FtsL [Halioglobus maricola]
MSSRVQGKKMVTAKVRASETASERPWQLGTLALGVLVLVSAFAVIHTTHACRELYTHLQALEARQWHLQEDYGRLLLEESTWASHYRVEKVARGELQMAEPDLARYEVVGR